MLDAYNQLVIPTLFGMEPLSVYILLAVLVVTLGLSWVGRKQRRRLASRDRQMTTDASAAQLESKGGSEFPLRTTMESSLVRADARERVGPEQIFFAADPDNPARHCPKCGRNFPGIFEVCPFDTTPLERGGRQKKTVHTALPRRFCPDCGRRFGPTAQYCYCDGFPLTRDFAEASETAPIFRVCRECGFETEEDLSECPRDGELLEVIDPSERGEVTPTIPFNRCRNCGHLGAPNETVCPVDGTMMLPEVSARLMSLPPTGFGNRRRICKECGSQFGDQCQYCSFDGKELIPIN